MFTVMRRFSTCMLLVAEYYYLNVRYSRTEVGGTLLMLVGAIVATVFDLSFDALGYTLITLNNVCTVTNGIVVKRKVESKAGAFTLFLLSHSILFVD